MRWARNAGKPSGGAANTWSPSGRQSYDANCKARDYLANEGGCASKLCPCALND
ncbi:hypothetical protein C4J93_0820 [Pseudomonas sp. R2-37-08W]|nr:hypothetical protein C4J93_0820 [Pseudomonas sp. R2-37-08W]